MADYGLPPDTLSLLQNEASRLYAEQGQMPEQTAPAEAPRRPRGRRDPFSQQQALGDNNINAELENIFPGDPSESPAARLARRVGVDESELTKPASGELAKQYGVEGVKPDFDSMEKLMKMLAVAGGSGGQPGGAGGAIPPDPAIRSALAYQALQRQAQAMGGQSPGGMLINSLGPLMAPRMLGPALERERAEQQALQQQELRAKAAATQAKIAETAQLGEKRKAETELAIARKAKLDAETIQVGKGKDKVSIRVVGSTIRKYAPDGTLLDVETVDQPDKPFVIKGANGGVRVFESLAAFSRGDKPMREDKGEAPSSATERKTLAEAYASIKEGRDYIEKNFKDEYVGPIMGRALEAAKAGGPAGQAFGMAYLNGLPPEQRNKAIDFYQHLQQLNSDLVFYYSKSQVPAGELLMRRKQLPMGTDYPVFFKSSLNSVIGHLENVADELQKRRGMNVRTLEENAEPPPAPTSSAFKGAPSTPVTGELGQRRLNDAMQKYPELQ